jgi:hypothetical protein
MCRDDYYDDPTPCQRDFDELRARLDLATRVACTAIKTFIAETCCTVNDLSLWNKEMHDWYKDHLEQDEKRRRALRESGRAKLTVEEREALGIL